MDMSRKLQISEGECQQRMKDFPLWDLAPDERSISRTLVGKDCGEGEGALTFLHDFMSLRKSFYNP